MIKILLVNEIQLMCNLICAALEDEPDITVVGSTTSTQEALQFMEENDMDVVLVSTRLPDKGALELTRLVTEIAPKTKVLALGLSESKEQVLRYVEAGAAGYILKDSSLEEMVETIRLAQRGEAQVSPKIAGALLERLSSLAQSFTPANLEQIEQAGLTPREIEVLELLGRGLSNQKIAAELVIEVGTVKNHVHNILEKLNVNTRDEAAAYLAFIHR